MDGAGSATRFIQYLSKVNRGKLVDGKIRSFCFDFYWMPGRFMYI